MAQHFYQDIGTPKWQGIPFPSVENEATGTWGAISTGDNDLISGGGIKFLCCDVYQGVDNKQQLYKTWYTQSGFLSVQNYPEFSRTLTNGKGICLMAIPKKTIIPTWDFNIETNKWYNSDLDTYDTGYIYLVLSNQGTRIDWKFNEYLHSVKRKYIKGEAVDSAIEEDNSNKSLTSYTPISAITLKQWLTETRSGSGQDVNTSYTFRNYDGTSKSVEYSMVNEAIINNIVKNYDEIMFPKLGDTIRCRVLDFGSSDSHLWKEVRIYAKIWTDFPIFGYDQIEEITNYFLNGVDDSLNKNDKDLLNLDWSTDWTLYVDGVSPNLKLVWKSEALEEYLENTELNLQGLSLYDVKIEISQNDVKGNREVISYVPYTNGNFKINYATLAEKFDMTAWDKFLAQIIGDKTGIGDIPFYFRIYYKTLYSTMCYCKIPYSTIPTEYGKLSGFEINTPTPDNSTVTIVYGSDGSEDDGYKPPEEDSDIGEDSGGTEGINVSGVMATTYVMTNERIKSLATFLWDGSFFDNIKLLNNSPIENIVSCKIMPLSVSGTDEQIILGNVETGVNGDKTSSSARIEVGELQIPLYYNSFLDFAPFTRLTIFLPFIGFKELDTNVFMNKKLKVAYVFDFVTGAIKAQLYSNGVYVCSFDGNGGIDIPLTSSNRAQVESGYIRSALTIGASIATGNAIGVAMGALDIAQNTYHYNTNGSFSPSCGFHDSKTIYVIYDRPTAQYPTTYNHNVGKPCELSRSLSSLTGFTTVKRGIDVSGISCTESEREEIISLLTTGIYL